MRAARSLPPDARDALGAVLDTARVEVRRRRRPRWGNFRRTRPFSEHFGYERGTPVDRVPIERFFSSQAPFIRGRVLEGREGEFARRHGSNVSSIDVIDIDTTLDEVTILADLCDTGSLEAGAYDCVIIAQTLHLLSDPLAGVDNLWQSLAPGGTLLVSVPTLSQITVAGADRWRFTPQGLHELLAARCPGGEVETFGYGSVLMAVAFLMGLAAEELGEHELAVDDPRYPVLACGRVRKDGGIR